jgi:hypothetical protein
MTIRPENRIRRDTLGSFAKMVHDRGVKSSTNFITRGVFYPKSESPATTLIEVWTGPTGKGRVSRYADIVRFSARSGESLTLFRSSRLGSS